MRRNSQEVVMKGKIEQKSLDIGMVFKRRFKTKVGLVMWGKAKDGWVGLTKEEFLSLDRGWQKVFIDFFSGKA